MKAQPIEGKNMPTEKEWIESIAPDLEKRLQTVALKNYPVGVSIGRKLSYAFEVPEYTSSEPSESIINRYETDILIYDQLENDKWIPRVVVEGKLRITTHDALTYSAKAATHKNVHPYLRYGVLLGNQGTSPLPWRLIRHGANFDFMAAWSDFEPADDEWQELMNVLVSEVKASRRLQEMLNNKGSKSGAKYSVIHRPLKFKRQA